MIGQVLRQRYQIIQQLGAGGFGETYLAEDLDIPVTPKQVCVVKRLQLTVIDPQIIRLFEQEAQILYQLGQNHDQIPKLYAYFQEDEEFYLIQEFIEGNDLTHEISPGKKLHEEEVIQLLRDVLEILVYVHDNNVIHRDIKPANIMRRKDGKLVLIDFGVVKQINTTIAMKSGLTSRTISIGTPGYMPPEQAMGQPKFSSDIYALGITAIQFLTGMTPHLLPEDEDGEKIWINLVSISNKLEIFINKMLLYYWKQRYRNAREALEELNQVFPVIKTHNIQPAIANQSSKYWFKKGDKLYYRRMYEAALESYEQAISIEPDYDLAWHNRGMVLCQLQKYTEAIASYDKAIEINPEFHYGWSSRGCALSQLQKYTEAIASYDKAIEINPDYDLTWNRRGVVLEQLKRYKDAITSYDKAIAINPDYYLTWYYRGNALVQLKMYIEAIKSYDKVIDMRPDYHQAWYNRGLTLDKFQRYAEAILSYEKAINIKPDYHQAWYNRGVALSELKRYEEALESYEKAISIQPDYQLAINNRNDLLKQLGRSS